MKIPFFKYHPDPLSTGCAIQKDFQCICCDQQREILYVGPVYSRHIDRDSDKICLECIADGSAAKKYDAEFASSFDNYDIIDNSIKEEVKFRTPGYICWQSQIWLTHCNDVCIFHGDFSKADLIANFNDLKEDIKGFFSKNENIEEIVLYYHPQENNNPAFYKFVCGKCNKVLLHCDYT